MRETTAPHLPGVDGLRGLAALLVAGYHAWVLGGFAVLDDGPARAILGAGYSGVDVFFVLSGLVLTIPFAVSGERGSLRAFAVRRCARLLPAYLLVMTVAAVFHSHLTHARIPLPPSADGWWLVLEHLLVLPQLNPDLTTMGFGSDGVIWTLTIEACFYVVLPFVAMWWVRRPLWSLAGAVAVAAGWQLMARHADGSLQDTVALTRQLPAYAAHFGLGMTLAVLLVRTDLAARMHKAGARPVLLTGGVVGLVAYLGLEGSRGLTGLSGPYDNVIRSWLILPATGALVLALATGGGRLLESGPGRFLGQVSYSSYLIHLLPMRLLTTTFGVPADGSASSLLLLLGTVPLTYLVAALSYRLFEVPVRRALVRHLSPAPGSLHPRSPHPSTGAPDARLHDRGRELPSDGARPGDVVPGHPPGRPGLSPGRRRRPHLGAEVAG
jgi:peptidoglycan/LPS O-acetylase OafA/YrhL